MSNSSSTQLNHGQQPFGENTASVEERQALFIDQTQPKNRNLIIWGIAILSVFAIVISVVSTIFRRTLENRVDQMVLSSPAVNLETERQRQQEQLHSYGFIDKQTGVVHIPIEEAMRKEVGASQ